jgi:hypothetical protein
MRRERGDIYDEGGCLRQRRSGLEATSVARKRQHTCMRLGSQDVAGGLVPVGGPLPLSPNCCHHGDIDAAGFDTHDELMLRGGGLCRSRLRK